MTAIVDVATHLNRQVPLTARQEDMGLSDADVRRFGRAFGYDLVSFDPEQTEAQDLMGATTKLASLRGRESDVRYVARARTVRSGSPYPISPLHEVTRTLGLDHAEAFVVTEQACASALLAVDSVGALLAADDDPNALALVLVGEKTPSRVAQVIPGMAVLGEATVAILVSANSDRDRLVGYSADVVPIADSAMTMGPEAVAAFGAVYADSLARVVEAALGAAGLTGPELALYLPHNINRLLCVRTADAIGVGRERTVIDNIGQTAHCWGADTFINYRTAVDLGLLEPGDYYLMTSVGLGAVFSAAVFQH